MVMTQKSLLVSTSEVYIKQGWAQGKDSAAMAHMEGKMNGIANREKAGCWGSFPSRAPLKKTPFCYGMLWNMGFIPTLHLSCRKGFTPLAFVVLPQEMELHWTYSAEPSGL